MRNTVLVVLVVGLIAGCTPSPRYTRSRQAPGDAATIESYNQPYTVFGKTYTPMERAPVGKTYRGLASFYG